jgi:dTDP-4-amino-4,6-dideoxygalactose transaminase
LLNPEPRTTNYETAEGNGAFVSKPTVPVLDLRRQYVAIQPEIDAAIRRVLTSGGFILGPEVRAFEEEVAAYCGVKHAIGVASGTDALLLSLRALDVGPGDAVILPSFTFFATAGVVHNLGATPILCDIDPKTFNLDPSHLRHVLSEHSKPQTSNSEQRTSIKALIPVHLYGQIADMDEIVAVAQEYGLAVIEDAAQAIGAEYWGSTDDVDPSFPHVGNMDGGTDDAPPQAPPHSLHATGPDPQAIRHELVSGKAGTLGMFGAFSFYPTKNLGGYGDGGLITTDDDERADKIRLLRVHGARPKYFHRLVGTNSRLDALQAAILRAKLRHLDEWSAGRQRIADAYDTALESVDGIVTPYRASDRTHIFHQYTIRVLDGKRDALRDHLEERGIGTTIYYPKPLHLQECFAYLGYEEGQLPQSEAASREVLSLPIFPELTADEQGYVVEGIRTFFERP